MAWNIPYAFVTYLRKDGKTEYGPKLNPAFVDEVKRFTRSGGTLLVMCRSGERFPNAVDLIILEEGASKKPRVPLDPTASDCHS